VINGSARVSAATRQKVLRVMQECGYTPNAFARGLGLNTMHLIGLLCADASDPYLAKAVHSLERELRASGYDSLLCCTGYAHENKVKSLSLLKSKRVDGLIFVGSHFVESEAADNEYIRRAADETPAVLLGGELVGENLFTVRCDERAAMKSAARRLLRSGRRRVLYLYNSLSYSGRNKLMGYREGWEAEGLPAPAGLALMLEEYEFDVGRVRERLDACWEEGLRFDAVLAADDRLAAGALKFLKRRGLAVPGDVAVIGCNDSPIAGYCDPELTSIDNRLEDLCRQCAVTLMAALKGEPAPARTVLQAKLTERESTDFSRTPRVGEEKEERL
jgi:LacI family transcriptional regulator